MFSGPGCFFLVILAFAILGFQRGWRREVISLVFVLLTFALIHPETSGGISDFLNRIPGVFAYILGAAPPAPGPRLIDGPFWSLMIAAGLVVVGYLVGNRVFKGPATPQERFVGIVPGLLAGVFVLLYLKNYNETVSQQPDVTQVSWTEIDPSKYIPVIFVIVILAVIVALIAARVRKAQGKK
jgi:hypothetical protein